MKRKFFSILTALALCLGLLPGTARAANEGDGVTAPEVEYSLDGGSTWKDCAQIIDVTNDDFSNYYKAKKIKIKLKRDITYDEYGALTLCFSGQEVEVDGQGHTIKRDSTCTMQIFSLDQENSHLTLKNITIDGGAVWNGDDPATRTNTGLAVNSNAHLIITSAIK